MCIRDSNNPIPVSDALAKKLGMYQKMSSLCKLLGAVSAVLVFVVFFAVRNKAVKSILDTVLFFAAFGLIYAGNFLYKKMRETMKEQLGGFFAEEFEKAYGKDEQMCIRDRCLCGVCSTGGRYRR